MEKISVKIVTKLDFLHQKIGILWGTWGKNELFGELINTVQLREKDGSAQAKLVSTDYLVLYCKQTFRENGKTASASVSVGLRGRWRCDEEDRRPSS